MRRLMVRGGRGNVMLLRGLAHRAVGPADVWLADGGALLKLHPVQRVRLPTRPAYVEFGSRRGLGGPNEYLYALGAAEPSGADPSAIWTHREPDDARTGRVAILLLGQRWPGIRFEF